MSQVLQRRALTATEVVTRLAKLEGWRLDGDGTAVVIQKTFRFADFARTMVFVNAVAWLANTLGRLGIGLKAGEVILSGALAAMFPAQAGDHFRVTIGGIGGCSVRFH